MPVSHWHRIVSIESETQIRDSESAGPKGCCEFEVVLEGLRAWRA